MTERPLATDRPDPSKASRPQPAPGQESEPAAPRRAGIWENLGTSHIDMETLPASPGSRLGRHSFHRRRIALLGYSIATLVLLMTLIFIQAVGAYSTLELPPIVRSPLFVTLMAMLVLYSALQTYTHALRSMNFYRRFIRPGLRQLLEERDDHLARGDKLFRGRKTVVMKIDIAKFTSMSFRMPYGMRRLYLDLWFTFIDRAVGGQVFFDKSLGDGSLYYFEPDLPGGSCCAALRTALRIRDVHVVEFDRIFARLLDEQMAASAEFRAASEDFLTWYHSTCGMDFRDVRTRVRIALVSGYVDEGLWGLSSRSHYDVQGNAPILASRMEGSARDGEIVFDRAFLDELRREGETLEKATVLHRIEDLKGVGDWEVCAIPELRSTGEGPERVLREL